MGVPIDRWLAMSGLTAEAIDAPAPERREVYVLAEFEDPKEAECQSPQAGGGTGRGRLRGASGTERQASARSDLDGLTCVAASLGSADSQCCHKPWEEE